MRKREQEANKFVCVSFRLLFLLIPFWFDADEDEPAIWIKDAEYALHCIV